MTSEVLMLNRDAVVIAADSAVTTGGDDPHPRYSKAANKIFDVCTHGNVAVTIYQAAEIDRVPWELALKLFRREDAGHAQRSHLADYIDALFTFLQGNTTLFPASADMLQSKYVHSAVNVLRWAERLQPVISDVTAAEVDRLAGWNAARPLIQHTLAGMQYEVSLDLTNEQEITAQSAALEAWLAPSLAATPIWSVVPLQEITPLAIQNLVKRATSFLSVTGVVFAGYGAQDVFPAYFHLLTVGHIGSKFHRASTFEYKITHDNDAMIQPFAQSAMIDRFSEGFDYGLRRRTDQLSRDSMRQLADDLMAQAPGGLLPADVDAAIDARHQQFMAGWQQQTWAENFHPFRRVLNSLSVSEMGHLAESLLVIEALRERVTSPSESVGGPIDVAVITKAEGLIWLKRKHFFDAELNLRYLSRQKA